MPQVAYTLRLKATNCSQQMLLKLVQRNESSIADIHLLDRFSLYDNLQASGCCMSSGLRRTYNNPLACCYPIRSPWMLVSCQVLDCFLLPKHLHYSLVKLQLPKMENRSWQRNLLLKMENPSSHGCSSLGENLPGSHTNLCMAT